MSAGLEGKKPSGFVNTFPQYDLRESELPLKSIHMCNHFEDVFLHLETLSCVPISTLCSPGSEKPTSCVMILLLRLCVLLELKALHKFQYTACVLAVCCSLALPPVYSLYHSFKCCINYSSLSLCAVPFMSV